MDRSMPRLAAAALCLLTAPWASAAPPTTRATPPPLAAMYPKADPGALRAHADRFPLLAALLSADDPWALPPSALKARLMPDPAVTLQQGSAALPLLYSGQRSPDWPGLPAWGQFAYEAELYVFDPARPHVRLHFGRPLRGDLHQGRVEAVAAARKLAPAFPALDDAGRRALADGVENVVAALRPYGAARLPFPHPKVRKYRLPGGTRLTLSDFSGSLNGTPYVELLLEPERPVAARRSTRLPAFPGAQGYGAYTPGGRGGRVYVVTTLEDYLPEERPGRPDGRLGQASTPPKDYDPKQWVPYVDALGVLHPDLRRPVLPGYPPIPKEATVPGSLRAALEAKGPRTVVFAVSGTIPLKAPLVIREPYVTVAGQSAPGDGVQIRNWGVSVKTHDVVLRHLRVRVGDVKGPGETPRVLGDQTFALSLTGMNLVVDHCEFAFANDQIVNFYGKDDRRLALTFQWNYVYGGLLRSTHDKGPHSMSLASDGWGYVSMHHNLLAHSRTRNPRVWGLHLDYRNNTLYDYVGSGYGNPDDYVRLNFVGNVQKRGEWAWGFQTDSPYAQFYAADNRMPPGSPGDLKAPKETVLAAPVWESEPVGTQGAEAAHAAVLARGGASLPARDPITEYVARTVRTDTGEIPGTTDDFPLGGYPTYRPAAAPADADRDGMPDDWERRHGLRPGDPADAAADRDRDGYTSLEEYLNRTDPNRYVDYRDPRNNVDPPAAEASPAPKAEVWSPDNGDGTYTNPVLFADYSDPDAVRVGDEFFLVASSFNCVPGLPVLRSKDLVNWSLVGHALDRQPPYAHFAVPRHGGGVWAPAIRHHGGAFYVYYPDPDFGIYLVKAKDAAGPWSEPVLVQAGKGLIDPCPLWDDDGKVYLVHGWAGSRAGIKNVLTVKPLSPDGAKVTGPGEVVFDGRLKHPTIEGPKFYKRGGYYYLFAPGGGVKTGWQTVLRSRSVYGPYEARIVLAQGRTPVNGPHQGAWVTTPSGEDWFLHFQDRGPYGRVVHLQPMRWGADGWPVIGADPDGDGVGEPVLAHRKPGTANATPVAVPPTTDAFAGGVPGPQWQWHANPEPGWLGPATPGALTLNAAPAPEGAANLWGVPNLLLQKFPGPAFTATARIDPRGLAPGAEAGLLVMGYDYAYLAVERTASGDGWRVARATCRDARAAGAEREEGASPIALGGDGGGPLFLRVSVAPGGLCTFGYSRDGVAFTALGGGDPFAAREGHWIGAKVGVFALGGGSGGAAGAPGGSARIEAFTLAPLPASGGEVARAGVPPAAAPSAARPPVAGAAPKAAGLHRDVEYGRAATGESLRLDAYVPAAGGDDGAAGRPVAVIVHGGGWGSGDKAQDVAPMIEPLVAAGVVCFSVNYRLAPAHRWPAGYQDVQAAVRWAKANAAAYGGDPARVALVGYSAGGHLACLAAVRAERAEAVQAVALFAAPTDLVADTERRGGVSKALQDLLDRPELLDADGREQLTYLSPVTYLRAGVSDPDLPPFLLVHGTEDKSVPYEQSANLQRRLRELGVPCELVTVPGAPHRLSEWDRVDASYRAAYADWVRRTTSAPAGGTKR